MTVTVQTEGPLPALQSAIKDADSSKETMHNLRHFHLGNPKVREQIEPVSGECLPALLDPFRDASRLRFEYPLYLRTPAADTTEIKPADLALPLSRFLRETVEGFAPDEESARILKDNLPWIERYLRQQTEGSEGQDVVEGPSPLKPLLGEAADKLIEQLGLDDENSAKLRKDLDRLIAAISEDGQILGYGIYPAIQQLIHVIRSLSTPRHQRFTADVDAAMRGLIQLLEVEHEKSEESKEPAHLRNSIGAAADLINPEALSGLMDHSHGSVHMTETRKKRIQDALEILKSYQDNELRVRFVHCGTLGDDSWLKKISGFESVEDSDPSAKATELFDSEAERLAQVFAALRIAKLEIDDIYDPSIHDPWFANFSWEAFSKEELLLVPAVIALESADRVAGEGRASLARLLSSGRPIQIMTRVQPYNNPAAKAEEDPFQNFRTELGYIGIAHRQAFVAQTSAARHDHLIQGFLEGLDATRTCLHLISTGLKTTGNEAPINAWLVAGAALEGRAHPFFRVNPGKGDSSADRMDFNGNPQWNRDWPRHSLRYQDENGATVEAETAFTFADYALLMPKLHHHFAVVPAACESDDLVAVADFLKLTKDEAAHAVPFIWGVDKFGTLQRIVVSRTLVHACRDRLNFWHALQEMSGVKNRYVDLAVTAAREEITTQAEADKAQMAAEHEQALTDARAEAAGEVMARLTDVLMGMDFSTATPRPASTATTSPAAAEAEHVEQVEDAPAEMPVEEEEELNFDEAWIDAPLCTSCNDCLAINPIMFVYNDNNQAVIADINAGTYAHLVEAAEICPSNCIHPGKPVNPGEPDLDELIARAAPYN
ncbi:MAG: ferredoxin [Candidatus Sedimenticola sp. PURPLELP]